MPGHYYSCFASAVRDIRRCAISLGTHRNMTKDPALLVGSTTISVLVCETDFVIAGYLASVDRAPKPNAAHVWNASVAFNVDVPYSYSADAIPKRTQAVSAVAAANGVISLRIHVEASSGRGPSRCK